MDRRLSAGRLQRELASWFIQVRLAATFLTIVPVGGGPATADDLAASLAWFPLIGFALGAALAAMDHLLAFMIPGPLRATLLVLALTAITGGVHLDGLADTADACGAGKDRSRALEILRDSRIGTFGATAVFFVLALKITALLSAAPHLRPLVLYVAPGIARWAMVAVPYGMNYLRERGAGTGLLGIDEKRNLRVATLVALIAILPVSGAAAWRGIIAALVVVWLLRSFYRRWLGGVTGDLIGAGGELVEAVTLTALVVRL
jgi:adenosylcobinamide-GDP ribazoletransferase